MECLPVFFSTFCDPPNFKVSKNFNKIHWGGQYP